MRKLMVGLARILPLCAVVLVLPVITATAFTPLTVQRVWTQDTGGSVKTTFAPGETIQFAAELNNPYGGWLIGANGTQLTITTSFYTTTNPVDIPPGISTWTWNATAPSTEGNYTVTVQAYDHASGTLPQGSASFTVGTSTTTTLTVQRVWTGDSNHADKTSFAPGDVIHYLALVENPGSTTVTATFTFEATGPRQIFFWSGPGEVAPGTPGFYSPATIPTDAPAGTYTLTVTVEYNGERSSGEGTFTVTAGSGSQPTKLAPGWYSNSGSSIIYEDSEVRIVWGKSYIYPYAGEGPRYWYTEVVYFYNGNQTYDITCAGEDEVPPVRVLIPGAANAGYIPWYIVAEETTCSRDRGFTITLKPGESFYNWVIFPLVPVPGNDVSLEWEPYGSSERVDLWHTPFDAPPPAVCPEELVTLEGCAEIVVPVQENLNLLHIVGDLVSGWKAVCDIYECEFKSPVDLVSVLEKIFTVLDLSEAVVKAWQFAEAAIKQGQAIKKYGPNSPEALQVTKGPLCRATLDLHHAVNRIPGAIFVLGPPPDVTCSTN